MTLIPLKWKRTVLFRNLGFAKHVFPRKQCFLKILIYITDYIHFKKKKKKISKWFRKIHLFILEKSRYTTEITNQGTEPRSQVKVHNNKKHFWVVCENIKSFPTYHFWVVANTWKLSQLNISEHPHKRFKTTYFELLNKKSTHIFWISKQEVHFSNYVWTWSSRIEVRRQSSIRLGPTSTYTHLHLHIL